MDHHTLHHLVEQTDGRFAGSLHGRPVMLTIGKTADIAPSAWPYRTRRRYMRRSVVHMRTSPSPDGWLQSSTFETHWPGDLTIWLAVKEQGEFVHAAIGGHGLDEQLVALIARDALIFFDEQMPAG